MLLAILIYLLFIVAMISVFLRKLDVIVVLPLLAVGIPLLSGVPLIGEKDVLGYIIGGGISKLSPAFFAIIIGTMLGKLLDMLNISNSIIRKAAELGGDKPFFICVMIIISSTVLFSTIDGLGSFVMLSAIAMPLMKAAGVTPLAAAGILIMSTSTGSVINPSLWTFYQGLTGIALEEVEKFAIILAALSFLASLIFAFVEVKIKGVSYAMQNKQVIINNFCEEAIKPSTLSFLTPIIPVILVVAFQWPVIPAFIAGIIWCVVTLMAAGRVKYAQVAKMLPRAIEVGMQDNIMVMVLIMEIGMVLNAFQHPTVSSVLEPLVANCLPHTAIGYVLFFVLLAPLALYRGPLNMWGLGSGVVGIMIGLHIFPPIAIMAAFLSMERVQCMGDPTNTNNVYIAKQAGATSAWQLTMKLMPYFWTIAVIGIIISQYMWL